VQIILIRRKDTGYKVLFKDNLDRVGSVYLDHAFVKKMGITDEIAIELAQEKSRLQPGGYTTKFYRDKETKKKVRFCEDNMAPGALRAIYVRKEILTQVGCAGQREIAVNLRAVMQEEGDAAIRKRKEGDAVSKKEKMAARSQS